MTDKELLQQALPCPFCGSDKVSVEEGSTFRWVFACCDNCDAKAGEVRRQTTGAGNPQEWHEKAEVRAIEEWNKRARLAQPEPEQVKYNVNGATVYIKPPLYTAPPKKEWQGMTDEEIFGIFGTYIGDPDYNHNKLLLDARRIEAKLKEKNHG